MKGEIRLGAASQAGDGSNASALRVAAPRIGGLRSRERCAVGLNAVMRGSRIGKAIGLAVMLAIFLVWWKFVGDPGNPLGTRQVDGVVTKVDEKAYVVRLDSGPHVRVFRTVQADVGTRVRLNVTRFESGEEIFVLPETGIPSR